MTEQEASRVIRLTRPFAKFPAYSHTDDFLDLEAEIGKGFMFVSLYDERINSTLTEVEGGILLIGNTYLSSFAYNLILAWQFEMSRGSIDHQTFNPLIRYNLKKFFAEQLLHKYNNTFSRAIFLETLLYEQHRMIPVIHAANEDPKWKIVADKLAGIMGNFLVNHELGHYYRRFKPEIYEDVIRLNASALQPFTDYIAANFNEWFREEIICDLLAVFSSLSLCGEDRAAMTYTLRAAVLGYHVFGVLWSLEKSAEITANAQRLEPDRIVFRTIEKASQEYSYDIRADEVMIQRSVMVTYLCEQIAADRGLQLYGTDGELPLPEKSLDYFLSYLDQIMLQENANDRSMSRLVAESLHDHPEGLEYLYLHSKVFRSERNISL
ncbi:hypothetical protein [Mucilaginibacter paludis]|uniref:Uncharacterized protein n=1 Tax=Mucilaginibacter paludis DSM 18603 TaxID=714943 RepID=H1Y3H9_9SPHI|nr:hypothetical protein [Mucilaginibacter paludis]EHQ29747.1 hypothetical protein Mucpa_5678 [Mucilaginibacter paludis DSM 18603]